jgi:O-antigen ligase
MNNAKEVAGHNSSQIQINQNPNQQDLSIDPSILQIVSYGGAIGALIMLLLIIRAMTKFVQEVKKDD